MLPKKRWTFFLKTNNVYQMIKYFVLSPPKLLILSSTRYNLHSWNADKKIALYHIDK